MAKMAVLTQHSKDMIGRMCYILRQCFILSGSECRDVFVITSADDVLWLVHHTRQNPYRQSTQSRFAHMNKPKCGKCIFYFMASQLRNFVRGITVANTEAGLSACLVRTLAGRSRIRLYPRANAEYPE